MDFVSSWIIDYHCFQVPIGPHFYSQVEVYFNLKTLTESSKINDFLPTLLLWTLSALLPIIVAYSDWLMGHWRRQVEI